MAQGSKIYKAELQIADLDRGYYADHALTLARHASETEERLLVRILSFALFANEALSFGAGISTDGEPDIWRRDLTGAIEQWIDVGLPDERLIRKACGRAHEVHIIAYGGAKADAWWRQNQSALQRCGNLTVWSLPTEQSKALAVLAERSMKINCMIQERVALLSSERGSVSVEPSYLQQRR